MRIGIALPPHPDENGRLHVAERSRMAESLGFDDLWCVDHTIFRVPFGDIQTMSSMAVAATESIQVCLGVVQGGVRHPIALAKWLGGLSNEAPGRLLAGLGVGGDYREEWTALGLDASERGARFDEVLAVLPALLANEPVEHHGKHYEFSVDSLFVVPPPKVPLWIGARIDGAIKRAAAADGWLGMIRFPDEFAAQRAQLLGLGGRAAEVETGISVVASVVGTDAEARDRCGAFFRTVYGLPAGRGDKRSVGGLGALRELIDGYREAGADRVSLTIIDRPEEAWEKVADEFLG